MANKKVEFTFGINSSNFNKNISSMNNQMKILRNEMQQASNDIVKSGNNLTTLANKYKSIENALEGAKNKVKLYEDQIKKTNDTLENNKKKLSEIGEQKAKTNKLYDEAVEQYGKESNKAQTLKEALDKLNTQYKEQENRVASNERSIQKYTVQMSNAQTEVSKLEAELARCNDEIQTQSNTFIEASEKLGTASEKFKSFGGKVDEVSSNILGMSTAVLGAVTSLGMMSAGFETGIAKVNTLVSDSGDSLERYKKNVIELSNDTGIAVGDLTNSLYDAISAGVDYAESVDFINEINKVAVGGFTDIGSASNLMTQIMNIYGKSVDDVADVSDKLFLVQKNGVTTVGELASSMGEAMTMGASYSVSLENILSSYASLTKQGRTASTAQTQLKAMIQELGDTASSVGVILEEKTGKSFTALMKDGKSLYDVLSIIKESCNGNEDAFNNLWSSTEAGLSAMSLLSNEGEFFNKTLNDMANSAGLTDEAYNTMANTTEFKLKKAINSLKNSFVSLGEGATPLIEKLTDAISKVAKVLSEMDSETLETVGNVALFTAGVGVAGKAVGGLTTGIGNILGFLSKLTGNLGATTTATTSVGTSLAGLGTTATTTSKSLGILSSAGAFLSSPAGWVTLGAGALAGLAIAFNNTQKELDNSTQKFYEAGNALESFEGKVRTSDSLLTEIFGKEISIKFSADFEEAKTKVDEENNNILEKLKQFYKDKYDVDHDGCTDEQEHQEHLRNIRENGEREHFKLLYEQRQKLQDHRTESLQQLGDYLAREYSLESTSIGEIQGEYTKWYNEKAQKYDENWNTINEITKNATLKNRELTATEQEEITKLLEENQNIQLELVEGSAEDRYNAYLLEMNKEKILLDERSKNHSKFEEDIQTAMFKGFQEFSTNIDEKKKKIKEMDGVSQEVKDKEIRRLEQMQLGLADFTNNYGRRVDELISDGYSFSDATSIVFKSFVDDLQSGKIKAQDFGLTNEQYMAIALQSMINAGASADDLANAIRAIPENKRAEVLANVEGKNNADALKSAIDKLKDKTVYVTAKVSGFDKVNYHYENGVAVPNRAIGDPSVNRSGLYMTQEKGWELVDTKGNDFAYSLGRTLQGELSYIPEGAKIQTNLSSTQQMKQEISKEVNRQINVSLSEDIKWMTKTIVNAIKDNGGADVDITNNFDITNNEKG